MKYLFYSNIGWLSSQNKFVYLYLHVTYFIFSEIVSSNHLKAENYNKKYYNYCETILYYTKFRNKY